jgi:hypothetical protein
MVERLDLPVFTNVFRLRRRLYRIYDVELPVPVSLLQVVAFSAAAVLVFTALRAGGVDLTPGSAWVFIVPPGVFAWLANRSVADERTPLEWGTAQVRHLLEPRTLAALEPATATPRPAPVLVRVWRRARRHEVVG